MKAASASGRRVLPGRRRYALYGVRDVLQALGAEVGERRRPSLPHLLVHRAGDHDAAGLGQGLEARGDVDAIAVDLLAAHDHVAQVDTDPELELALARERSVARRQLRLGRDGAGNGVRDARELGQHVVAHGVHDAPAVLAHQAGDAVAMGRERVDRGDVVLGHETAVSGGVHAQDRRVGEAGRQPSRVPTLEPAEHRLSTDAVPIAEDGGGPQSGVRLRTSGPIEGGFAPDQAARSTARRAP